MISPPLSSGGAQGELSSTDSHRTRYDSQTSSDEIMGSLGNALAGVSINPESVRSGFGFKSNGVTDSPFPLGSNGTYIGSFPNENTQSWGAPFPSAPGTGFPGANSMPGMANARNVDQAMQQRSSLLSGAATPVGSYEERQRLDTERNFLFGMENLSSEASNPARNQSLELFLSQSPSKSLGENLLKFRDNGLPSMNGEEGNNMNRSGSAFSLDEMGRAPGPVGRKKVESPSCSVTGTSASSRSVSPYANANDADNPRTIHAYHGRELGGSSVRGFAQQPSSSDLNPVYGGFPLNRDNGLHNQLGGLDTQSLRAPQLSGYGHFDSIPVNQTEQQGQSNAAVNPHVLYMAVPTPDGRGQMLQPVQMLQIPGQPSTFVLPPNGALPTVAPGGAASSQLVLPNLPSQSTQSDHSLLATSGARNKAPNWSVSTRYPPTGFHDPTSSSGHYGVDSIGHGEEYLTTPRNHNLSNSQHATSLASGPAADSIASLYAAPQRPSLDALLGHVRRLSRDQVGCRLLQQALDEEGSVAATLILNEGISFWGEAMVDPFGNYLFQKILEKVTGEERIMLIKSVSARLVNASLNLHGTRSVQKVVELCATDVMSLPETADGSSADVLTRSLAPAAARLCIDSHGNHVIQRILLKLGHRHSRFVFDAVAASVGDVARHRHGCCVIQRCLDSPPSEARSHLVRRIVEKSLELMQDAYGNYVVQYVLDVCGDDDVQAVCESVVGKVSLLAIQKFSSNVMEKCLERCADRVKEHYLQELSDSDRIRELMMDPFGNYVVQRALSVATHTQAVRLVEAMKPHLIASQPGTPNGQRNGGMRNTAGGRRIMAKICRRFPNFTLTAVGPPEELYSQQKGHHRNLQPPPLPYPGMTPGLQAVQYGGDPNRGRRHGNQRQAYFDPNETGYSDHMPTGHGGYPHM